MPLGERARVEAVCLRARLADAGVVRAGAQKGKVEPGIWSTNVAMRRAEQKLARQGEQAYKRTVADWQAVAKRRAGADATPGRASQPI